MPYNALEAMNPTNTPDWLKKQGDACLQWPKQYPVFHGGQLWGWQHSHFLVNQSLQSPDYLVRHYGEYFGEFYCTWFFLEGNENHLTQSLQSQNPPSAFWESVQCDLSPLWYGVGHSIHELEQCSPPEQTLQTLHAKDRSHWPEAQWDFQEEAWRLVNQRMRYNGRVDQKHVSFYIKANDIRNHSILL